MGSERAQAMVNEAKNPYGKPRWLYVDRDELERLGITEFRAAVGDNIIRIIPPSDPRTPWAKRIFIHRNIGANNSTFLCLDKMFNKPCPICEYVQKLKDEDTDRDTLSALWPKLRHLIFLYDVTSQQEEEKGLRWWNAPASKSCAIVENIVALSKDPKTGAPLDVSDPETGMDIKFVRKGTDRQTTYMGYQLIENGAIPKEWYESVPTFESVLDIPTYEEMYKELHGVLPENDVKSPTGVDEKETPVNIQQETEQPTAQETRTRRSYRSVNQQVNSSEDSNIEQSINQRLEEIKRRRAARVDGE